MARWTINVYIRRHDEKGAPQVEDVSLDKAKVWVRSFDLMCENVRVPRELRIKNEA